MFFSYCDCVAFVFTSRLSNLISAETPWSHFKPCMNHYGGGGGLRSDLLEIQFRFHGLPFILTRPFNEHLYKYTDGFSWLKCGTLNWIKHYTVPRGDIFILLSSFLIITFFAGVSMNCFCTQQGGELRDLWSMNNICRYIKRLV